MGRKGDGLSGLRVVRRIRRRLSRIRHFRGHGVHSPYVYRLVREVFMSRGVISSEDHRLYDALMESGDLRGRYAAELQNIFKLGGYADFGIDCDQMRDFAVYTTSYPLEKIETSRVDGTTVVVLQPYSSRERERACEGFVSQHNSTTVARREYLLLLNNHLPKQHFQL